MTNDQIGSHLLGHLTECLDSFVLVGFTADRGETIILSMSKTEKDAHALANGFGAVIATGMLMPDKPSSNGDETAKA